MTELILRSLFMLACASIGYKISVYTDVAPAQAILIGLSTAFLFIGLEVVLSKRPIQSISAIVFGLITGGILAAIFSDVFLLVDLRGLALRLNFRTADDLKLTAQVMLAVVCCYVAVMVIYKTRDRFRFIIPYVEFKKEERGARPILVDTSAVIDGRLTDLCNSGIFDTTIIVPKFVLQELQHIADSGDRLRRNRGRRGLEMLQHLQRDERIAIQIHDARSARGSTVDSKLVSLASQLQARILTCDYNLAKIAELQNVDTINLNDLATALRPTVLSGEEIALKIIRPGDEAGQGIGYLNDGTMVVVEQGREHVGHLATVIVTNTLQTSAGRMVFARIGTEHAEREAHPEDKDAAKKRPPRRP